MLVTIDDVRPVEQERPVALVRLGDEVLAAAVVGVRADLGDLAADHERRVLARRAAGSASPSTWWWSCRGCRRPRSCGGRSSPRPAPRSGAAPAARAGAPRPSPGGPAGSRSSRRPCRRRPGWTPRGSCGSVPPSARSAARAGHSRSSLPETGMPRVSSSRARPLMPTPPTPMRCTVPSSSAVSSPAGVSSAVFMPGPLLVSPVDRRSPGGDRLADEVAAGPRRRRAGRSRGGRAHRGQPLRVPDQRDDRALEPVRGQLGVVDEQAATGLHHRQRVALLLLVAVRVAARRSAGMPDRGQLGAR